MNKNVNLYFSEAIRVNWDKPALTDIGGTSYCYSDVATEIAQMHLFYANAGIAQGDKIAICGKNCASWGIVFLSVITYGAIAVPILHEFKSDNIHHIVNHSDAKLLFCDDAIWATLDASQMPQLHGVLSIAESHIIMASDSACESAYANRVKAFDDLYKSNFTASDLEYFIPNPDALAVINYTSGSTGFSKGVMIPYRALWSNIKFCIERMTYIEDNDSTMCMLPLAHMYGLVVELLYPFAKGCHVSFLTKAPSPRILLDAFVSVQPRIIITVPLVIEKIIKMRVFPKLEKPMMKLLLSIPGLNNIIYSKIRAQLIAAFGGRLMELIVGGAAINKDVETFLAKIKFPYTVGYGMTECAPLVCYEDWDKTKKTSCGRVADRMELKINSADPHNVPGELCVRGDNVMLGYYKNEEATAACLSDGWLNTGDLCTIDESGLVYIHGRSKNMILGPSGQNIYPEEIENKINNMPMVSESIVIDDNGKLVALVHPDVDGAEKQGIDFAQLEKLMHDNISAVNHDLPAYSQIREVRVYREEFEKTPKRSIKRYLYQSGK